MNEQKNLRDEDRNEKKIKFAKVFIEYFRSGATMSVLLSVAIFLIFSQFVTSASDYFITFWTNQELLRINQMETMFSTKDGLYIYGFLILAVISVTLSRGFIFFAVCMRASKKLHDTSFLSLLHSPMRFFDLNPVGRILNRFRCVETNHDFQISTPGFKIIFKFFIIYFVSFFFIIIKCWFQFKLSIWVKID